MLFAVAALSAINLICLIVLLIRRSGGAVDPRLAQLPEAMAQMQTRMEALDSNLRNNISDLRREQAHAAEQAREATGRSAQQLREEVLGNITKLGETLRSGFDGFRGDNAKASEALRAATENQLATLRQSLSAFISDVNAQQAKAQEMLHTRLNELGNKQSEHLEKLNKDNTAKLEEMRVTVDEKLQKTLHSRLTESFGQVTTHLGEVQKGLGEMKELATGVNDLKRVFTNVKTRGGVGEFLLGELMAQMFAPDQYIKNARIKSGSQEIVEYALKVPSASGETLLLAIDSKFPQADWERLEEAYEKGTAEEIAGARKSLERAVRTQGESICKKYIHEPDTLPYAVMFLPTEGLYAEVLRSPGLVTSLQQDCQVMVVGPSTFMHIMANFRMAFRTMAIQAKGGDVMKVLGKAKREFEAFGGLMDGVQKQVTTVQNTLEKIRSKTTTINRALKTVDSEIVEISSGAQENLLEMEDIASVAPMLAASEE